MPAESPVIRSRPELTESIPLGSGPLPVLTRIPWLNGDSAIAGIAGSSTTAPALTHFEYLMGEFGLNCDEAASAPECVPPLMAISDPSARPQRRSEPSSPPEPVVAPRVVQREQHSFDWTEMALRFDAAIEPYTRAIVLLVLMAVAAFTALLLSSDDESPRQSEPPLAQAQTRQPSDSAARPKADAQRKQEARPTDTNIANEAVAPTAQGPASIRLADSPPVATLSADIQPTSPEAVADSSTYPSTSLPEPKTTESPSSQRSEETPQDARQRDEAAPIHPYK